MDFEVYLRNVRIDLQNAHFYGRSWNAMGRDTGLSPNTIRNFATRKTSNPAFKTVVELANYAGYAVTIARENNAATLRVVT